MTGRVAPGVDPASHSRSVLPTTRGVTTGQVGPRASESSSLRQGGHERRPPPTRPTPSHKTAARTAPSAVSAPSAATAGPTPASGPREPASDAQYREATAELAGKPTHAAAKHQVGCPGSGGRSACTEESESGAESGERAAGERRSAGASSGSVAQCSGRVSYDSLDWLARDGHDSAPAASAPSAASVPSAASPDPTPATGPRELAGEAQCREARCCQAEATAGLEVKPVAVERHTGCPGRGGRSAFTDELETSSAGTV